MTREEAKKRLEVRLICAKCPEDKMCYDSYLHSICEYTDYCDEVPIEEAVKVAIEVLEQEPCEDAVSRQAVLIELDKYLSGVSFDEKGIDVVIKELPPVSPQPKMGQWIFVDKAKEHAHCSECDYGNVDLLDGRPHNYCPSCGTKMQEVKEWKK